MRRTVVLLAVLMACLLVQRSSASPSQYNVAVYTTGGSFASTDSDLWDVSGNIGIDTNAPQLLNYGMGTGPALTVLGGGNPGAQLELASTVTDTGAGLWGGLIDFDLTANTGTGIRMAEISGFSEGGTTANRGGVLAFFTKVSGAMSEGLRINSDGNTQVSGNISANGVAYFGDTYISGTANLADTAITGNATISGNATVSGNIAAKYQDVAEWVEGHGDASPGTVMTVSVTERDVVQPSDQSYDTAVAGVISAQPGIVLGEPGPGRVLIAHSGRVRVKVDATFGAVHAGDLLVTSPTPGYAMRSTPLAVGGASFHRPGTVLGKALESLEDGRGEILVLVTLQ